MLSYHINAVDTHELTRTAQPVFFPVVIFTTNPPNTSPTAAYEPCGSSMVICDNQCVPYGTRAVGISGRILADDGSPSWNAYNNAANGNTFARGNEHEWAQWQLSYDNSNWYDINGATQASYAPGIITQAVTYYRRTSTHIEHHWYGDSREDWYISNVVTITSGPATPTAAKSYTTCGSGPISIAVNNAANATSYNWYSVDPAWDINGQGRFQNNTGTSVQITPPANVAAGTYTFNVVANGSCTQSFGSVTVTVDPNATTPMPTSYAYVDATPNKTCRSIYNLATPVIPGATSYTATINGRTVAGFVNSSTRVVTFSFRLPAPQYGVVATITVTGNCAPATFTTSPDDLEDYGNPNGCDTPLVADAPEASSAERLAVYPNPAANQGVLQGSGQVVEVSFYDAEGQCRKTVKLREEAAETAVNILDLPAGTYHLRMVADGKLIAQKQLIIER